MIREFMISKSEAMLSASSDALLKNPFSLPRNLGHRNSFSGNILNSR
jgi:hypothetical protein